MTDGGFDLPAKSIFEVQCALANRIARNRRLLLEILAVEYTIPACGERIEPQNIKYFSPFNLLHIHAATHYNFSPSMAV